MPASAGSDTRFVYLWEESGGSPAFATDTTDDSDPKTFGYNARLTDVELDNNVTDQFDPGSREAAERLAQAFSGSWSAEFTLSNPWFWKAVIAEASSSGTSPTTHTFDGSVPYSMRLVLPVESTGNERILKGCVATSCTLETSDNGEANVSLSGAYADEEETSPGAGSLTAQDVETYDPLTFADGSLTFDGTTYSLVQNVSVTIENTIDMVPALGQRTPADYSPKVRSTSIDWGRIVQNDDLLVGAYGGSGSSPATRVDGDDEVSGSLVFDNGESGASKNEQTINFAGTLPDSYARSGTGDPSADYVENLGYGAREVDVTAVNDDGSAR